MKVAEQIRNTIQSIPKSKPFGYADLNINPGDFYKAAKAIERLQKKGQIKRVSKGVFYVPQKSMFGELGPNQQALIERYLFKDGKRIAYETGFSLYNKLALTTQMAFKIKIATNNKVLQINQGALEVRTVKSYVEITEQNYELLGLLDAIKDVKKIPDCSVENALKRITFLIKQLSNKQQADMVHNALFYPARTRAVLGAILENIQSKANYSALKNSLNPLTTIHLGIQVGHLPTITNWQIK